MTINDPRDEAILALASAIHHINMNKVSRSMADRAEGIIRGARLVEHLEAQRAEYEAAANKLKQTAEISQMLSKHMPVSVSTFGGSDGVHGWTGTDAAGNRVTWKVEPTKSAGEPVTEGGKRFADTLTAFTELAPAVTAAAEKRFAADPFAPTFELEPGAEKITITLRPRPGSVQYLIDASGPQSSAITFVSAVPKLTRISGVVESPQ